MLGVALWTAGTPEGLFTYNFTTLLALQSLDNLIAKSSDSFYTKLKSNPLKSFYTSFLRELQRGNAEMKIGMLRGIFCTTGDTFYLKILFDLGANWKLETLTDYVADMNKFCI